MKPIIFNTENVCAILNGQKTATRRVIKPQPEHVHIFGLDEEGGNFDFGCGCVENGVCRDWVETVKMPYQMGDTLYVRETWQYAYDLNGNEQIIEETGRYLYAADDPVPFTDWIMPDGTHRDIMPWRPSIHMPKEAARIFLRVTDIRAERLQDINDEGAKAEGANFRNGKPVGFEEKMRRSVIDRFAEIWDRTVPRHPNRFKSYKYYWKDNPWVWVIEFERIRREEAEHLELLP